MRAGNGRVTARWGLVVPVKLLTSAKSRLAALGEPTRAELALAFAADVVTAARACEQVATVVVVTDDGRAARTLAALGVRVEPDRPGAGLNAALDHGAGVLCHLDPGLGVAALAADLPTLRPADLSAALLAVRARAYVPDLRGTGTTLLAAAPGQRLLPAYGRGSRLRHRASGAVELAAPPQLRLDVDTPADLRSALLLGVGPRTTAVATGLVRAVG